MMQAYEAYHFKNRKRRSRSRLYLAVKVVAAALILYLIVTTYVIASYRVGSQSMSPSFLAGDRLLVLPLAYRIQIPFTARGARGVTTPRRGDLVLVLSPEYPRLGFLQRVVDPVVRFFTLQKVSIVRDSRGRAAGRLLLKRVIGIPGDTVRLEGFNAYIRTPDSRTFEHESAFTTASYQIEDALEAENWTSDLPFSGDQEPVTLAEDQYFVLGDNRTASSDSRSRGPVPLEGMYAKVLIRYWPFKRSTPATTNQARTER